MDVLLSLLFFVACFLVYAGIKKNNEPRGQLYRDLPLSETGSSRVIVKRKSKEDKGWSFFKEITVDRDDDYGALCEAAYLIAGTENPRINQASERLSATVVLRSKNISYRFEMAE